MPPCRCRPIDSRRNDPIGNLFNLAIAPKNAFRFGVKAHGGDKFAAIMHDAVKASVAAGEPKRIPEEFRINLPGGRYGRAIAVAVVGLFFRHVLRILMSAFREGVGSATGAAGDATAFAQSNAASALTSAPPAA